jgi:Transposase
MGALALLGFKSPFASTAPPAGAASRARMCKDGTTDVFIGIDVSKDRLDICLRPSGEIFAVTRDDEGLEHLVERLRALAPVLVALEATGGYETVVASALAAAHLPLAVINPRQIRDFARSTGKLAKTDRLDAAAHSPSKRRASFDALSPTSPRPSIRPRGAWPTARPRRWANSWRVGGSWTAAIGCTS